MLVSCRIVHIVYSQRFSCLSIYVFYIFLVYRVYILVTHSFDNPYTDKTAYPKQAMCDSFLFLYIFIWLIVARTVPPRRVTRRTKNHLQKKKSCLCYGCPPQGLCDFQYERTNSQKKMLRSLMDAMPPPQGGRILNSSFCFANDP